MERLQVEIESLDTTKVLFEVSHNHTLPNLSVIETYIFWNWTFEMELGMSFQLHFGMFSSVRFLSPVQKKKWSNHCPMVKPSTKHQLVECMSSSVSTPSSPSQKQCFWQLFWDKEPQWIYLVFLVEFDTGRVVLRVSLCLCNLLALHILRTWIVMLLVVCCF